jgi:hypothetical protein
MNASSFPAYVLKRRLIAKREALPSTKKRSWLESSFDNEIVAPREELLLHQVNH